MENRVFFPQAALDQWIVDGTVDLTQDVLTVLAVGRRYKLAEGIHVTREVSGAEDPHGLVGRAKPKSQLEALGAEIIETSMLVGEQAYDIVPGWLGVPVGSFAEYAASDEGAKARGGAAGPGAASDEALLAAFAAGRL
ncbi:MAG TPA: hypothetical protein VGM06_24320 [Polyangiaceae bacterium]|jgi:hypothetical protein